MMKSWHESQEAQSLVPIFRSKQKELIGINFKATEKFSAEELVPFLRRDIFFAIKNGKIPAGNFQIKVTSTKAVKTIEIFISDLGLNPVCRNFIKSSSPQNLLMRYFEKFEEVHSDAGLITLNFFNELLEKYNRSTYFFVKGRFKKISQRFATDVRYCPNYLMAILNNRTLPNGGLQ